MLLFAVLQACVFSTGGGGGGGKGGGDGTAADAFETIESTGTSKRDGTFNVDIEVQEGDGAFQVITESTRNRYSTATEYLVDPDGNVVLDWNDWYNVDNSLTEAFYPGEYANTFNWPIRAEDGPLTPGTWTWKGATVDGSGAYTSDVDVNVHVLKRQDDDFQNGTLNVVIAYCTGLEQDAEIVRGIEAGVAYWRELYGAFGVDLNVTYTTIDIDPALPDTYEGMEEYRTLMADWGERGLLMVIGDTIADSNQIFGEAGGIPGPYYPEPLGAVEVSWMTHAGGNGTFSDDEIGVLGETMAHESGHYLGMFHPVEMTYNMWDAIDDTVECTSWNQCDNALGGNLMYPYPICSGRDGCDPQSDLSDGQIGVMQRYVGVE